MLLYSIIILLAMAIIATLNSFFNPLYQDKFWLYIIFTIAFTIGVIILDGVVAFVIRKMPEKWFSKDQGIFKTRPWEMKFYNFLKVSKWKERVPELGSFTGFHKNKVANPFDNEYIARFILEARYGVAIHLYSCPLSFLIMLFDFGLYNGSSNIWLTIALPVACVNAVLIVLPAFILKYNLPKLIRIYEMNLRKEQNKQEKRTSVDYFLIL